MPVYNTGEILRLAVDSIIAQTHKDWELLLIDDGSSDNSSELCDAYGQQDCRIRVFHKKNGGICDSRNYGLERAQGDYVAFCDHDDEYHPRLLEIAIKEAEESGSQIVNYRSQALSDDNMHASSDSNLFSDTTLRTTDFRQHIIRAISLKCFGCVWRCLYHRDFLIRTGEKFDTNFKHGGEDLNFNLRVLCHVNKLSFVPTILYTHYIRKSLSTSAKVYLDFYELSSSELPLLNALLDKHGANPEDSAYDYSAFVARKIRFVISYGAKCKASRNKILNQLHHIRVNNRLVNKYPAAFCIDNMLLVLLKMRAYTLLYMLGKVYSKI